MPRPEDSLLWQAHPKLARCWERHELIMQFCKGGIRIKVGEVIRVQPLGQLLNSDEVVGAVVELVIDRMHPTVLYRPKVFEPRAFRKGDQTG